MGEDTRQGVRQARALADPAVPAIELLALCKAFGTLQAVDHLTLAVKQGEIFGLLGPNGSGKTTTINLISGLAAPTGGEVRVMGYQIPRYARTIRQMLGPCPRRPRSTRNSPPGTIWTFTPISSAWHARRKRHASRRCST